MSDKKGTEPINPVKSYSQYDYLGLTKREYFAGLAMQGWLASLPRESPVNIEICAKKSVELADALLKQLSNE